MSSFAKAVTLVLGLSICFPVPPAQAQSPKTVDIVKARGSVVCAVTSGLAGFSQPDDKGAWSGLDVDYCRAIAAAVLGDPGKVSFRPTNAKERFTVLQSGEADVLARNSTWTLARDSALGLVFVATNFYDGQGFMVRKSLGIKSARDLKDASICVGTGSTTELNLADYFRANGMSYKAVSFENADEVIAYDNGRCDAVTSDASGLYAQRTRMKNPEEHVVLPEIISKEPLALAVRQGDDQWLTIVKWVHFAVVNAEELQVTQANVDDMKAKSTNPDVKRLLGTEGDFGKGLGLDNDWATRIIKAVGNYGDIFERNVGTQSRLKIARGLNELWSKGGIQYAPPIR